MPSTGAKSQNAEVGNTDCQPKELERNVRKHLANHTKESEDRLQDGLA